MAEVQLPCHKPGCDQPRGVRGDGTESLWCAGHLTRWAHRVERAESHARADWDWDPKPRRTSALPPPLPESELCDECHVAPREWPHRKCDECRAGLTAPRSLAAAR